MTIPWKWFWITIGIALAIGMIIVIFLYPVFRPYPEIEPVKVKVKIETPIEVPPQKIAEEGVKKAEIRAEKQPEANYIKEEIKGSWRTNFIIAKKNYRGDLFVEFMLPDSLFEYRLDLDIQPDTIQLDKYIDVLVPAPRAKVSKIKFFYAYLGGGVSFESLEGEKLRIAGGCVDAGVGIKKTWLIYGSVDSYGTVWLKTGFLF